MKILILHHNRTGEGGGVLTYCHEVKKLIDGKEGHEVDVPMLDPGEHPLFKRKFDSDRLRQAISDSDPDVVHVNGTTSICAVQAIRTAKKMGKRVVLTPHWHPFKYMNHPLAAKLFFHTFIRPALKSVDAVITINKEEHDFFSRYHKNVLLIPHWMRHGSHSAAEGPHDKNKILFVGRLNDPNKGIEHLYHLPLNKYSASCVGKGAISERDDIRQFNGLTDEELQQKYREAGLVVVPSRYEAFSYVALEALSHGCPVVMSERVRIADSIQNLNECCRIFRYHDYEDFKKKIDEARTLNFDPEKVMAPFLPEMAYSKYKAVYKGV